MAAAEKDHGHLSDRSEREVALTWCGAPRRCSELL
jgi:hypothetical protein